MQQPLKQVACNGNHGTGYVSVMMDVENIAYGFRNQGREARIDDRLEIVSLLSLAGEAGPVATARAYADWRCSEVGRYQSALYSAGFDIIPVLSCGPQGARKNATDMQMTADAIEAIWTLPHVTTFVIVSGDRDFLSVVKTLHRYGKMIVGVALDGCASKDLAGVCDRFVFWSELQARGDGSYASIHSEALIPIKKAIGSLLEHRKDTGMKGAELKPLLRKQFPAFDEKDYGCASLGALLRRMGDVVRIEQCSGGDFTLWPASNMPLSSGKSA